MKVVYEVGDIIVTGIAGAPIDKLREETEAIIHGQMVAMHGPRPGVPCFVRTFDRSERAGYIACLREHGATDSVIARSSAVFDRAADPVIAAVHWRPRHRDDLN